MTERPLGELIQLSLDQVDADVAGRYPVAGVYSFGRGMFKRGPILGSETSYKKLNRLHVGQLVVSRLKAFEGALAVVPVDLDGWYLSPEFPTFECIDGRLDLAYLGYICRWPEFWALLRGTSRGIGARRERVHAEDLLRLNLDVPSFDEQRKRAARLDTASEAFRRASDGIGKMASQTTVELLPGLVDTIVNRAALDEVSVGDAIDFVSDTVHPGDDPAPATSFVGLQHIESHTGRLLGSDPLGPMKGRKFRFQPGDVLFGYLRPYLNKVWLADRHGLCSVDQYVLRPRNGVDGALMAHCLRGRNLLNQAIDLTHSLQLPRLRSGLLAALEVPVVPDGDAASLVTRLDRLRDQIVGLGMMRRHQEDLVRALVPSALNEAFAGLS